MEEDEWSEEEEEEEEHAEQTLRRLGHELTELDVQVLHRRRRKQEPAELLPLRAAKEEEQRRALAGWGAWAVATREVRLCEAAELRLMGELRALLAEGVDVNAADGNGWTALHLAAREGHVRAVHMLIEAGADVHATTDRGETPLHLAVHGRGQSEAARLVTVERLVEAGADVNAADSDGRTVLHFAARNAWPDVVSFLLSLRELDVLAVNEDDKTALSVCDDMISSRVDRWGRRIGEENLARLPSVREMLVERIVKRKIVPLALKWMHSRDAEQDGGAGTSGAAPAEKKQRR